MQCVCVCLFTKDAQYFRAASLLYGNKPSVVIQFRILDLESNFRFPVVEMHLRGMSFIRASSVFNIFLRNFRKENFSKLMPTHTWKGEFQVRHKILCGFYTWVDLYRAHNYAYRVLIFSDSNC